MQKPILAALAALVVLITVLVAWFGERDFAPSGLLSLDQSDDIDLRAHLVFLPDRGQTPAELVAAFEGRAFLPTVEAALEEVIPYQPIWAMAKITNRVDQARSWRVTSEIFAVVGLKVLLIDEAGAVEPLLDYSARAAFDPSLFSGPRLRSKPFSIEPGESVYLLSEITRGPVATAALRLETPERFSNKAVAGTLALTAFYALSAAAVIFFLAFSAAMRNAGAVGYAILLLLGLGIIAYIDGLAFRFLYPDWPAVHLPFGLVLMYVFCAAGFWVAAIASRLYGAGQTGLRRIFAIGSAISVAGAGLVFVLPPEVTAPAAYILVALMLLAQLASATFWSGLIGAGRYLMQGLTAFCGLACLIGVVLLLTGRLDGDLDPGFLIRCFYVIIAVWIMSGVTTGLVDLRRVNEQAMANEVAALRRATETAEELLQAEQNYSRARDLARQRSRRLATASHDLKQPVMSLRMTMDTIVRDQAPEIRARLGDAFDYIETLSQGYLEQTEAEAAQDETVEPESEALETPAAAEPFAIDLVLQAVGQMFREEAISKGVRLRVIRTSLWAEAPVMAVMRIVSNLVSNAVKYTNEGSILTGVRPRGDNVEIWVIDTGPGMSDTELEQFAGSYMKGDASTGHGLGLSICFELSHEHSIPLRAISEPGRGTAFRLSLPVAERPDCAG